MTLIFIFFAEICLLEKIQMEVKKNTTIYIKIWLSNIYTAINVSVYVFLFWLLFFSSPAPVVSIKPRALLQINAFEIAK